MTSVPADLPAAGARNSGSTPVAAHAPRTPSGELTIRRLSGRERQVLGHFALGQSTKSIARMLGVSPRTVETYSAMVVQKLGARNRIHAVAIAFRTGIIGHPD